MLYKSEDWSKLTKNDLFFSYKHAFDGLWRVYQEEGLRRLFAGASTATSRAVLMTIGQLSFYDQVKLYLLSTSYFEDNIVTHFVSSLTAVSTPQYIFDDVHSNIKFLIS